MLNYQNSKHSKHIGMYKQNKTHKYFMSKTPIKPSLWTLNNIIHLPPRKLTLVLKDALWSTIETQDIP